MEEEENLDNKKAIYRTIYDSGAVLQNLILPNFIYQSMNANMMLENKEREGIPLMLTSLSTLLPPLQQVFPNYPQLKKQLWDCRTLNNEWIRKYKKRVFPTELAVRLQQLYEDWWDAFNRSGAGLKISVYRDPIKERWKAITGSG